MASMPSCLVRKLTIKLSPFDLGTYLGSRCCLRHTSNFQQPAAKLDVPFFGCRQYVTHIRLDL